MNCSHLRLKIFFNPREVRKSSLSIDFHRYISCTYAVEIFPGLWQKFYSWKVHLCQSPLVGCFAVYTALFMWRLLVWVPAYPSYDGIPYGNEVKVIRMVPCWGRIGTGSSLAAHGTGVMKHIKFFEFVIKNWNFAEWDITQQPKYQITNDSSHSSHVDSM